MKQYEDAKIGQKVKFRGAGNTIGKCEGIITQLFPLFPGDAPYLIGFAIVEVEKPPHPWPYMGNDFAPSLNELEILSDSRFKKKEKR